MLQWHEVHMFFPFFQGSSESRVEIYLKIISIQVINMTGINFDANN